MYFSVLHRIPLYVYVVLILFLCLGILLILMIKKVKNKRSAIGVLLLIEYLFVLYGSTIIYRIYRVKQGHNFNPFWSYQSIVNGNNALLVENIMNILLFVPLGLFLGMTFRLIKWWQVLLSGLFVSVSIEVLQFVLKRGFSEFDDVVHNVLGCMIGFCILKLLCNTNKVTTPQ